MTERVSYPRNERGEKAGKLVTRVTKDKKNARVCYARNARGRNGAVQGFSRGTGLGDERLERVDIENELAVIGILDRVLAAKLIQGGGDSFAARRDHLRELLLREVSR